MSRQFAVTLRLEVLGPNRAAHFEQVVDQYATLEQGDAALLDCAWSLSNNDEFGEVEVEVTVQAEDEKHAYTLVSGSVRAAIHAAHGYTPGWDEYPADYDVVEYRLRSEEVALA